MPRGIELALSRAKAPLMYSEIIKELLLMDKHSSRESDTFFDITGEIKQVTTEIIKALEKQDEDLVEVLFEELIDLINSHENKYEAAAYTIIDSLNLTQEYQAKARAYRYLAKRLKERLQDRMNQRGLRELDAGIFTLRIKRNGHPTVIVDIPAEKLPEEFHNIKPNKEKLRLALSNGVKIEGVTLEIGEYVAIDSKG